MKTYHIITNPVAGKKTALKNLATVEKILKTNGVNYQVHTSKAVGDATNIAKTLTANGENELIVLGGDGTLHEVINGFKNFENVSLGILPLGTGNDFATALNLPLDPIKALDVILNGMPVYTDFMQMPGVRGLNVIGMGMDVEVLKKYEKLKKKTKFGYTKCLLKTLLKYDCVNFTTEINGDKKDYHSFIACVANGHCFGGGISICPMAKASDNYLDFVSVDKVNKFVIIKLLIKLMKKKIHTTKQYYHETVKTIKIIPEDKDYTINVDGELYENVPFEIEIVSDKLKIYR